MTAQSVALGLIGFYQRWMSPMLPAACRFHPSCSQFAREAVELYGARRGARLAAGRLLRCHPFNRGGFDPVPSATLTTIPGDVFVPK